MRPVVRHVRPMVREEQRRERKFMNLVSQMTDEQKEDLLHLLIDLVEEQMKKEGSRE